jgi:hypothetical protein
MFANSRFLEDSTYMTPTKKLVKVVLLAVTFSSVASLVNANENQMRIIVVGPDSEGITNVGFCFTNPSELTGYVNYNTVGFGGSGGFLKHSGTPACPNFAAVSFGNRLTAGVTYNYSATATNNGKSYSASTSYTAPASASSPTPTPTTSATSVATSSPTPTPTTSATSVATSSPTPTPTTSATSVATSSPTPTPTTSATSVATSSPTPTPTPTRTSTPTVVENDGAEESPSASIAVAKRASGKYLLEINSNISGERINIRATKKGQRTISYNASTDDSGDISILTSRNLLGYTLTLRYEGIIMDKVLVKR